jgi:hypothetical protein
LIVLHAGKFTANQEAQPLDEGIANTFIQWQPLSLGGILHVCLSTRQRSPSERYDNSRTDSPDPTLAGLLAGDV